MRRFAKVLLTRAGQTSTAASDQTQKVIVRSAMPGSGRQKIKSADSYAPMKSFRRFYVSLESGRSFFCPVHAG
jgi:hypothetical protein